MAALRTGLIGLDSSHPADFVPLIRGLGHEVVAVVDGGQVREAGYAVWFAEQHGIPHVARSEPEIADLCDAALVLGVDWDRAVGTVEDLVGSGLPVFLDKPLAGKAGHLRWLTGLAEAGYPITGGSSLRYAAEAERWRADHAGTSPGLVLTGTWGHPLDYGVHAAALVQALLGPGIDTVRATPSPYGLRGVLSHRTGAEVVLEVPASTSKAGFFATVVTDEGVTHVRPATDGLYRPMLARALGYLTGELPPPVEPGPLVEPELTMLALAYSAGEQMASVRLEQVPADFAPWSGGRFSQAYREARRSAEG